MKKKRRQGEWEQALKNREENIAKKEMKSLLERNRENKRGKERRIIEDDEREVRNQR